jgi:hypothetical protein
MSPKTLFELRKTSFNSSILSNKNAILRRIPFRSGHSCSWAPRQFAEGSAALNQWPWFKAEGEMCLIGNNWIGFCCTFPVDESKRPHKNVAATFNESS